MGRFRVVFTEEQNLSGTLLTEITVDAARLVLLSADNDALLDVPVDVVQSADRGSTARTERLRGTHSNHGRAWTAQEEAELRRLWSEGKGVQEIAERLGRSRGAVGSAARRLGLVDKPVGSS
ncbi:hypothetical protein [Actinomadura rudentiformis]|uniref:Uncharacterized protein n=1 Tax=Actinomadura rudentiformis TaxID=359158 RepID=A0A6H9YFJ8_9ACTN|nr:hypothetical protein [Actinomadura rudentiformis]KAB2342621.1 hypothetical protein F8566_36845 [Actinomadura rudentiformis]